MSEAKNTFLSFLKRNAVGLAVAALLGGYVVVSGMNRSCGACAMATDFIGLSQPPEKAVQSARPAPAWTAWNPAGESTSSSEFEGDVMILAFWATWCPPCRREVPGFIELQETYGERGLQVVGLSVDQKGPGVVESYAREAGINYPVLMADEAIVEAFGGVRSIPTTFIIDREGRIASKHIGYQSKEAFEREIKALL